MKLIFIKSGTCPGSLCVQSGCLLPVCYLNLSLLLATMGLGIISLTVALVLAIALGFGVMLHFGVDNNGSNFAPGMCLYKHFSTKRKPDKITFENQTAKGIRPIHPAGRKSTSANENQDPIPTSNRFSPLQSLNLNFKIHSFEK